MNEKERNVTPLSPEMLSYLRFILENDLHQAKLLATKILRYLIELFPENCIEIKKKFFQLQIAHNLEDSKLNTVELRYEVNN